MKYRVFEIAREAGVSSNDVLSRLRTQGEYARSASSTVSEPVARRVLASFAASRPRESSTPRASETMIEESTPPSTYSWQANPVHVPRDPDVMRNISALQAEFPIAGRHRQMLAALGSQFVYAKVIKATDGKKLGIALVRFSGAIEAAFGITREVMFFYAPYYDLQMRTFARAEQVLASLAGRATPDLIFFHSPDDRLTIKLEDWSRLNLRAIPVPPELTTDPIEIVRLLRDHVYARDLFYETTPVHGDRFFGRKTLLQELKDDIGNQRVSGIFGLRKSGKTSVLQQLTELLSSRDLLMAFVDLEVLPSPPEDPTESLIATVAARVAAQLHAHGHDSIELDSVVGSSTPSKFQHAMEKTLRTLANQEVGLVLLLDEIEFLTPTDRINVAEGEFSGVAQVLGVLRSLAQSPDYQFTFLLSGLTNDILDSGRLYGRPNPLFSWAKARYVGPFPRSEADEMAISVGARMGIEIEGGALKSLYEASGGHAYLYRNLASTVVSQLPMLTYRRVIRVPDVLHQLIPWKRSVAGNLDEIFGHLERYYPTESILLDILIDSPQDFAEYAKSEDRAVHHLTSLGLLTEFRGTYQPSPILELR